MSGPPGAPILRASGISKLFAGVRALHGVDFELLRGEVHALLGENGAGKSTLIKVITGVYQPDGGSITLDARPISPQSPREAERSGISTVYQEVNLIPQVSVAENICLGRFPRRFGFIRWRKAARIAEEAIQRLGVRIDVSRPLDAYSIAIQQMVAIARAVGGPSASDGTEKAKVLILDEPTSSLDADEVLRLFAVMNQLRHEGLGIVFVTHFLDQVYRISDRITVLRNGELVGTWRSGELARRQLVSAMVGKELADAPGSHHGGAATQPAAAVRVSGIARQGTLEPVTFDIARGESVGLAGLLGSGRTETARLIFGSLTADAGHVEIDGKPFRFTSPRRAIAAGLAMTSEDRKANGVFPNLSVRENIVVALQARRGLFRRLGRSAQAEIAARYTRQLAIKAPHTEQPISALSGGNQQKCLLARWLATSPRLLILDEPTRGIDVGAKAEIRRLVDSLCTEGMSVLFISSELEELVEVCDQVVVLRDRRQIAHLEGKNATPEAVLAILAHDHQDEPGAPDA